MFNWVLNRLLRLVVQEIFIKPKRLCQVQRAWELFTVASIYFLQLQQELANLLKEVPSHLLSWEF